MLKREGYLPVWLESGLLDLYYNGFCNSVLWQLFHYVPLQLDGWQRVTEHQTLQMQWGAYQKVSREAKAAKGPMGRTHSSLCIVT